MIMDTVISKIRVLLEEHYASFNNFRFNPKNPMTRLHEPTFGPDEVVAALEPMLTTRVTMGEEVRIFEKQYAEKFGHAYGVMNNSGSSANLLAISALANPLTKNCLKAGDEVIVPALSWSTTIFPLIQNNLVPVLVDCDPRTLNIDLHQLKEAISNKTKAIMLVHVYGNPTNMDEVMEIADKYGLQVIEDSCESMGASYKDKAVGTYGRVGTFSFYFSHHITTLEGGICVTDDFELTENMRALRAHGWSREMDKHHKHVEAHPDIDPRFIFVNLGYNLRPTECQAKMGQVQLMKLDGFIQRRVENHKYYKEKLSKYNDIFQFQCVPEEGQPSWFGFTMVVKDGSGVEVRELSEFLKSRNIENRPIIAGNMSRHPVMSHFNHRCVGELVNANKVMHHGMALPCHQAVDKVAIDYIVNQIDDYFDQYAFRKAELKE